MKDMARHKRSVMLPHHNHAVGHSELQRRLLHIFTTHQHLFTTSQYTQLGPAWTSHHHNIYYTASLLKPFKSPPHLNPCLRHACIYATKRVSERESSHLIDKHAIKTFYISIIVVLGFMGSHTLSAQIPQLHVVELEDLLVHFTSCGLNS
jgi:hypothetical protein